MHLFGLWVSFSFLQHIFIQDVLNFPKAVWGLRDICTQQFAQTNKKYWSKNQTLEHQFNYSFSSILDWWNMSALVHPPSLFNVRIPIKAKLTALWWKVSLGVVWGPWRKGNAGNIMKKTFRNRVTMKKTVKISDIRSCNTI